MSGLPWVIHLLLCVAAGVMGFGVGTRAHRRQPVSDATHVLRHSPHLWLVVGLPLALLGFHLTFALVPEWEWRLPYPVQYFYGPVAWGVLTGCFAYFAGFGGAVFLETRHRYRFRLGAVMLLLLAGMQFAHARAVKRVPPAVRSPRTSAEGFVFQTSLATCVPAAAASLLASLGDHRTEAELVELLGTDRNGTLPAQLVMALRRLGWRETTFSVDRDGLASVGVPSVVFLRNNVHAITLLRHDQRGALIWDPARGRVFVPADRVAQFFSGAHAIAFRRDLSDEAMPPPVGRRGI